MFHEENVKIYVQGPNDEPTPEPEQPPIPTPDPPDEPDEPPLDEPDEPDEPERREYTPEHIEPDEPWEQD